MHDPMSIGSPAAQAAPKSVPLILRILSGFGGIVVFLLGLLFSFGAILAAPLGIWFVQRWRRRHDRRPSRIASLFGAITACSVFTVLVWGAIFTLGPHPSQEDLRTAVVEGQRQPAVKLPGWYTKMFPQAASADSASRKMMQSPGFVKMALVLGAVTMVVFFGVLGGGMGWATYALLHIAWAGRGV